MEPITTRVVALLSTIIFLLMVFYLGYISGKASLATSIGEINGKVAQQNAHAKKLFDTLTAERDQKQAVIDNAYRAMEKKDAQAKIEIDRLSDELRVRPVRVRIECPRGNGGGSAAHSSAADADHRAGNASATYGVLPAANTERLAIAIRDIEQLNAAFGTCKAALAVNQFSK